MRVCLTILALLIACPSFAQDEPGFFERLFRSDQAESDEEQGSLLEQLLEEQLSGAGRQVVIEGFEGALTGAAKLDLLSISDDEGVWLTLRDAELEWNRAALFRGRIEVAKLTADTIQMPRLPLSVEDSEAPSPEATGFQLPTLPVSIQIDEIAADSVELGAPILGVAIEVSTAGSLSLSDGTGAAVLDVIRLDGQGKVTFDAAYSNSSNVLGLELALEEEANGILANLLGLPGRPAVDFSVTGEGPLSEYTADIRLASDGEDRLTGQISTFAIDNTIGTTAEMSGDIAPLFAPDYRPFFGENASLEFSAFRTDGGGTVLKDLSITANALSLTGEAVLGKDMMPRRFKVEGLIASEDGSPVLLPLTGEETRVDAMLLTIEFDASRGEDWSGRFDIDQFSRGDVTARALDLRVLGQIASNGTDRVTGDIDYRFAGLNLGSASLQSAVGDEFRGDALIDWESGRDLRLSRLTLAGDAYRFESSAIVTTGDSGPQIKGSAAAEIDQLAVFSGIAGRSLSGAADLEVNFDVTPLAGTFAVSTTGLGRNIQLDEPRTDAVLAGNATLDISIERDGDGLRLTLSNVETDEAKLSGWANLISGGSSLSVTGRLNNAGILLEGLVGNVDLDIQGREDGARNWGVIADIVGAGYGANWEGRLIDLYDTPRAEGQMQSKIADLSAFAAAVDRPIGGSADLDASGSVAFDLSAFSIESTAEGSNIKTGFPDADLLLRGATVIELLASGSDNSLTLSRLKLTTDAIAADVSGTIGETDSQLDVSARLNNIEPFVAGIRGPVDVAGSISEAGNDLLLLDLSGTGPGGIRAAVRGTSSERFGYLNLDIEGQAPLELANRVTAPNSASGPLQFDLTLSGSPSLSSLSGRISAQDARLVAPEAGIALNNLSLDGNLGGNRLQLAVNGDIEGGGSLQVTGPIGLVSPLQSDLTVNLRNARVTDPRLFETTVNGAIRLAGPLAGGARITGQLGLGLTEVRIPSSGLGGAGAIPEIVHLNEPPPVRGTRRRAGLLDTSTNGRSGGATGYPLDLTITAPNQIFVRGRGLDSEFGGILRLNGTTKNVIPSGGFNLIRGRLDILGRRLELTDADITIRGSPVPRLNLVAATTVDENRIAVQVTGPADMPDIAFTSSPELPQEEVISRLIFGRGVETLSAIQAARLALAVRTLAGRGGEGVVDKIRSGSGLADFDVTTTEDGNAAVRAGAYLNENVYTDVTVDSTGETRLNLNLDVSPSVTVKGGVSSEGDSSVGIFFERDY